MSIPHDADVIIAGAGMAGATLALALAQGGLSVILVDPQPFEAQLAPTFDGRASAVAFASFRQWKALGVGPMLEPHAQRIEQILVTDGRSPGASSPHAVPAFLRFDSAEIADRSDGEPLGYMVENRRIRAGLAEAIGRSPVRVLAPARLVSLARDAAGAKVTLDDGRILSCALVVGAEGKASVVRREAGIGDIGWRYRQSGVVATVRLEHDHAGVAHEYFLPGGPFAILPLTERRASLVWTESTARGEALLKASLGGGAGSDAFHAHLQRRFGEFLGKVEKAGPTFVYPLALSMAEDLVAPRVALLGDAAQSIHPIAGQGLNLGLKGAAALAEVTVEARRLGEDIGAPATLERYARWRRFDNVALAVSTDLFTRLFSNDDPLLRLARGLGMAAVNRIGPARRFFMAEAGGAVGDLPRLLRGEPL